MYKDRVCLIDAKDRNWPKTSEVQVIKAENVVKIDSNIAEI